MKRKLFLLSMILLVAAFTGIGVAYAKGSIKIVINGKEIQSDVAPRVANNRVMVPISVISQALGANVTWDQKTQTVKIDGKAVSGPDIWKDKVNVDRFDWAAINNAVNLFMVSMDTGNKELITQSVTGDLMDPEALQLQHFSMGPIMFAHQIIDAKQLPSMNGKLQYAVRVEVKTWHSGTTIDYWDLTLSEVGLMHFKVKSTDMFTTTNVNGHPLFPGLSFPANL